MAHDSSAIAAENQKQDWGRIIVVRHGRPVPDRDAGPRLTWQEYRDWWANYERSPLADGQEPSAGLIKEAKEAPFIFCSIRPRAIETAQALANGRPIVRDEVFVEAPLPPPQWKDNRRFLPRTWNKIARISWLLGHANGEEPIETTRERASEAADKLVTAAGTGDDVVLAAHGWFNRMLRPELKARGWRCIRDGGDSYWSCRVYEKTR